MTLLGPADRAAGEHADDDNAEIGGLRVAEEVAVILRRIAGRQRSSRARVEEIEARLRAIEAARVDDLMERGGRAIGGDAEIAQLPLVAQLLERRHNLVEHGVGGEIGARGGADDGIVELVEVDPLQLQALQAGVERGGDRGADLAAFGRRQPHLGADTAIGL